MGHDTENRGIVEVKLGEQTNEPYQMKDGEAKQRKQSVSMRRGQYANNSTPQQQPEFPVLIR